MTDSDNPMEGMRRPPMFIAENRPRVRKPGPTVHLRPASGPKAQRVRIPADEGRDYASVVIAIRGGPVAGCTRDKCYHRMAHEGGIR